MKIVRTIFFTLLAIGVIACAAVFIFFQSFNCTQYLSAIEVKASAFLGRPVSIAGAGLGLSLHGLTLDAGPVVVGDDPNFTTEPFIEIQRVRVSVDLRDLIFHRKIHIKNVLLDSPEIHFIRSAGGIFNFQSIAQAQQPSSMGIGPGMEGDHRPQTPSTLEVVKKSVSRALNITPVAVQIKDAAVSFIDQSHDLPLDIWLNDINGRVDDFSLSKPIPISWQASFYSNTPNVHGQAIVLVELPQVELNDFKFQADFSRLDQASLEDISPGLSGNPILKSSAGIMQLNIPHLVFTPSSGLDANGNLGISGGVIKNVNVVKLLLEQAMKVFGGLSFNIDNLLGSQSSLAAPDTTITKAQANFSVHNQDITIQDSVIQTNIFELTAQGTLQQGSKVDMQTVLHLNQDVSDGLINQFKGLKLLCDDSQRLTVEASLKGTLPHLKYQPTKAFRKKGKKVLIHEGLNMLGSFLGGGFFK